MAYDRVRRVVTLKRVLLFGVAVVGWLALYRLSHFAAGLILVGVVLGLPALLVRDSRDIELFGAASRLRDDPAVWPRDE